MYDELTVAEIEAVLGEGDEQPTKDVAAYERAHKNRTCPPLHWGAKGMSLIVGLALGTAASIALANGHGTLGIFAANHLTELVWGAAAGLLIVLSQLPRVGAKTKPRTRAV